MIDAAVTLITGGLTSRFDELPPHLELRSPFETVVRVVLSHIVQLGKSDSADIAFIAQRLLAVSAQTGVRCSEPASGRTVESRRHARGKPHAPRLRTQHVTH